MTQQASLEVGDLQAKWNKKTFYSVFSLSCQKLLNSKPGLGYHHMHACIFLVHPAFQMLSSMTFRMAFGLYTSQWLCTAEGKAVLHVLCLDAYPDLLLLKGQQGKRDLYKGKTEPPLAFSLRAGLSPLNLPILLPILPPAQPWKLPIQVGPGWFMVLWCWTVTHLESGLSVSW